MTQPLRAPTALVEALGSIPSSCRAAQSLVTPAPGEYNFKSFLSLYYHYHTQLMGKELRCGELDGRLVRE